MAHCARIQEVGTPAIVRNLDLDCMIVEVEADRVAEATNPGPLAAGDVNDLGVPMGPRDAGVRVASSNTFAQHDPVEFRQSRNDVWYYLILKLAQLVRRGDRAGRAGWF